MVGIKNICIIVLCLSITGCATETTVNQAESETKLNGVVTEKIYTTSLRDVNYTVQAKTTSFNGDSFVNRIEVLSVASDKASIKVNNYKYWLDIYTKDGEGLEVLRIEFPLSSDNDDNNPPIATLSIPIYSVKVQVRIPYAEDIDCVIDFTDDEKHPDIQHIELYGLADKVNAITDIRYTYTWDDTLTIKITNKTDGKETQKELSLTQQEIDKQRESNKQKST